MNLTRGKVAYNLEETPYIYKVYYPETNKHITFHFSSEFYRTKFIDTLYVHRQTINESLKKRFKITVNMNLLSDIKNYEKIEKRGFLIESEGQKFKCLKILELDGMKIKRNS